MINSVYLTGYALDLTPDKSYDDFIRVIELLSAFLASVPKYNCIETTNDFFDYTMEGGEKLEDILLQISVSTGADIGFLLASIEQIISQYLSRKYDSGTVIHNAQIVDPQNPTFICFYSQIKIIPHLPSCLLINSIEQLYDLNCKNLSNYPVNSESFCRRCYFLFDEIVYHQNFESSLLTVKDGNFQDFSKEFVIALRALHIASKELSTVGNNKADLTLISSKASLLGMHMDCTPEGKGKQHKELRADFKFEGLTKSVSLNCEYHLKINPDRAGKKHHLRAYFGLHLIGTKKHIALFHLGCHL